MRPAHLAKSMIKFTVPRGHDGFWEIILRLHAEKGEFTIPEIDAASNVSLAPIRRYVMMLKAAGFIEQTRPHRINVEPAMFRLVKVQRATPRVRKNGSVIPERATQMLWTAMRNLKSFSNDELRFAATTDPQRPITYFATKAFIGHLMKAGYLTLVHHARHGRKPGPNPSPAVWRLKPSMDTGPLPPRRLPIKCEAMWDDNLKEVVGEIVTQEPQP